MEVICSKCCNHYYGKLRILRTMCGCGGEDGSVRNPRHSALSGNLSRMLFTTEPTTAHLSRRQPFRANHLAAYQGMSWPVLTTGLCLLVGRFLHPSHMRSKTGNFVFYMPGFTFKNRLSEDVIKIASHGHILFFICPHDSQLFILAFSAQLYFSIT